MGKAKDDFRRAASGRSNRSESRQRTRMFTVRFSDEEAEIIRQLAERTGLSAGALIRRALLNAPPPPSAHRPSVDIAAVDHLLVKLEPIGSNINQHAKHANMGRFDHGESIRQDLLSFGELRLPCLQALGYERDQNPEPGESGLEG